VTGYTIGTWFVIISALTLAVHSDEDVSFRVVICAACQPKP